MKLTRRGNHGDAPFGVVGRAALGCSLWCRVRVRPLANFTDSCDTLEAAAVEEKLVVQTVAKVFEEMALRKLLGLTKSVLLPWETIGNHRKS